MQKQPFRLVNLAFRPRRDKRKEHEKQHLARGGAAICYRAAERRAALLHKTTNLLEAVPVRRTCESYGSWIAGFIS